MSNHEDRGARLRANLDKRVQHPAKRLVESVGLDMFAKEVRNKKYTGRQHPADSLSYRWGPIVLIAAMGIVAWQMDLFEGNDTPETSTGSTSEASTSAPNPPSP